MLRTYTRQKKREIQVKLKDFRKEILDGHTTHLLHERCALKVLACVLKLEQIKEEL